METEENKKERKNGGVATRARKEVSLQRSTFCYK